MGFLVEHRGVEPLTSTLRTLRATNCANAPYAVDSIIIAQHERFCKGDFLGKCVEKSVKEDEMCVMHRRFEDEERIYQTFSDVMQGRGKKVMVKIYL